MYYSNCHSAIAVPLALQMLYLSKSNTEAAGGCFHPETFGFWTPASLATLRIIASKTIAKTRLSFSQAFSNLYPIYI